MKEIIYTTAVILEEIRLDEELTEEIIIDTFNHACKEEARTKELTKDTIIKLLMFVSTDEFL